MPQPPEHMMQELINHRLDEFENIAKLYTNSANYIWSDNLMSELNAWCQENVMPMVYYGCQIMSGDLKIHNDKGTMIKLYYLITTGGDDVVTNFYDAEDNLIESVILLPRVWYIFNTGQRHTVQKQTPWVKGKWRYTISGRIFPYYLHPMMRTMNEGKGTTGEYIVPERKIYKYDISDKL